MVAVLDAAKRSYWRLNNWGNNCINDMGSVMTSDPTSSLIEKLEALRPNADAPEYSERVYRTAVDDCIDIVRQRKPVSIGVCASAVGCVNLDGIYLDYKHHQRAIAKAVLDAAGVKYHED
jgi:hypothetical protein